ncbi:serine/threonine-protein kinase [Roseiconus lacunae]|uniref:serine/threonine-protein kinase n=1 Tax=Roseiconus lacunae TaxID=2605694 RepID=UPI001E2B298F|nr:serine/threonine-protein kinase [Roseiconus lacunae]MCD0462623.1 serine/threonine-protein kinase [Roseiconus lacunae]
MNDFSVSGFDLSVEPSATRNLTDGQRDRLAVLLDEYLVGLERGTPPNVADLVADDPELAEPLTNYVHGLEDLHQVAAGFAPRSGDQDAGRASETGETSHTVLGDFELIEEVGRGGMGVVYRAQQRSLDRTVAIKLLPFAAVLDSRQITRFRNEAQAAAQLQHPNIVPVYTVGVDRGVHYYAMQFIEGQSFAESIASHVSNQSLPEIETCVRQGIAVAGALHAAHETGVVHRDIKPSNLLLGNDGQVWVTDFGLARCQTDVTMTRTGDIVGTMKYMSPEQARGESAIVDGRTDVYSLGVTLYEMLCLRPAFDGGETPVVLRQIEELSPTPLRSNRPDVPNSLETVIAKAMSKNRDSRYDTALEFAEDLQRVLDGTPTIARNPTFLDRAAQWAVARKRAVAAGVAFGLVLLIGLAVSIALIAAAKQESDRNAILAKRSSQLARTTVDELGAKMAELLADIPEAESVRRQLLQETLAYYQSFADQVDDDPQLIKDLAVTYGKIGSLQNEIGSSEQAIEALSESRILFTRLVEEHPGDWDLVHQLATSENNLALALDRAGRYKAAEEHYQSAIEIGELLIQSDRENAEWRTGLSLAFGNYALLLGKTRRSEESERMLEQSLLIAAIDEDKNSPDNEDKLQRQLASTYQNLSGLLAEQSPKKSIEYAREALRYQMDALARNENDSQLASQVGLTLNSLGAAQAASGDSEGAILSYRQAADIQRQLYDRQPYAMTHQRDLAVTENNLGLALAAEGQYEPARHAFDQALQFQQTLATEFADDAEIQSTLGGIYNNLGFVQEKLSDLPEALRSYRMAVQYQQAAHKAADEVPRYREFLSKHFFNCARLLREDGQTDESIKFTLQRRDLWLSDPSRLSGVADEFLSTATVISLNKSSPGKITYSRDDCVRLARETITKAIGAGFDPPDEFFDRPEYQDLRPNTSLQGI